MALSPMLINVFYLLKLSEMQRYNIYLNLRLKKIKKIILVLFFLSTPHYLRINTLVFVGNSSPKKKLPHPGQLL